MRIEFLDFCHQILYHEDMHEELYDIKVDVGEAHNLADVPLYATTVRELRVRVTQLCCSGCQSVLINLSICS